MPASARVPDVVVSRLVTCGQPATVPITMGNEGLELVDGVEAKEVLVGQLASALEVIEQHDPTRIACR